MDFLIPKFQKILEQISSSQKAVDIWFYYLSFSLAIVLALYPGFWSFFRNIVTIFHEGSHALTGFIFGRGIKAIKLNQDTSGYTVSQGGKGIGLFFTTLAGYIGPSIFSILLATGFFYKKITLTLVILEILLLIMFLFIRNIWGFIVMVLTMGYVYFIVISDNEILQSSSLLVLMWFASIGGFKSALELRKIRQDGFDQGSDSEALKNMTLIPRAFWDLFFILFTAASFFVVLYLSQNPYGIF